MDTQTHWEKIYTEKAPNAVSWYRPEMPSKSKYFVGSAPSKWLTLTPTCSKKHCRTIRHADDLEYYGYDIPWAGSIIPRNLSTCQRSPARHLR